MNAPPPAAAPVPAPVPLPKKRLGRRSDLEFLAPALEIIETPASPIKLMLMLAICGFFFVAVLWSYVGRIDIIAAAPGKIEPNEQVKVIQPLETGKVLRILARDGDHVDAGQTIVALDTTAAAAALADASEQLSAAEAEVARRQAMLKLLGQPMASNFSSEPLVDWPDDVPQAIRKREQAILDRDFAGLQAQLADLDSQIVERQSDAGGIASTVAAQQSLVGTLDDLVAMRKSVLDKGAGSKADWLDALQNEKLQAVTLATDQSQATDNQAAIEVLKQERAKTLTAFMSDYAQKLGDAEKQVDDLTEKRRQAEEDMSEMTLKSPIDGIIQASTLTTLGQIVSTGEELMRIVPDSPELEIQAYMPNEDVGFIKVGQTAAVKVAAFPFTEYGTVAGRIVRIGSDAVAASEASQDVTDPTRAPNGSAVTGPDDGTASLVFPVTVALLASSIRVDGHDQPLLPGMGVTVEVNTGSRRIIDFLFSPLVEVGGTALRER